MKPKFKKFTIYLDETIRAFEATLLLRRITEDGDLLNKGDSWLRIRIREKSYYISKYMNKSGSHTIWIGEEK